MMDEREIAMKGLFVGAILLWLCAVIGIGYVVIHFVVKFW